MATLLCNLRSRRLCLRLALECLGFAVALLVQTDLEVAAQLEFAAEPVLELPPVDI